MEVASHLSREEEDAWYLEIDKDQLESMNWSNAPTDSTWTNESADTGTDYAAQEGRTRLRRYEEDLDVNKVERQVGDVSVSKRVVEETKTIEVPVRREEVHIERHPVTDAAASSDMGASGKAFDEQTVRVPVMEEQVEVRKVVRPVEEIEITKTQTQDTERVEDTVRREEFDVDDQTQRRDSEKD